MKTKITLTRQERIDILTDGIETRAIQYWAYEESGELIQIWRNEKGDITKIIITMPSISHDGSFTKYTATPATIQKGIDLILSGKIEIREDIKNSILENDNDSESCDCIIQAGIFEDIIYG